jgi:acetoin utilization protein AcuC
VNHEDVPLLVFGPRSASYDFGPQHPLTPRRFGPGIDLLRSVGAEPGLAPEPASDEDLRLCHTSTYLGIVRRFSDDPFGLPEAGIGNGGDNPPFHDMHDAAASVAGGSLRAVEAILRGDVQHGFHPGGGLHHAMADRASGFCIYDDPALAIARARRDGLRVLYVDLDVHHGDGVEALFRDDPGVLTISFHESGRYLFPGTGAAADLGDGIAAGTIVNVPFEPFAGEQAWLPAVTSLVPSLAAAFGPDLIVSQHGADSHAWDPLAHLRVTTTAMGEAARLVDRVAHRHAEGRWLATGGGGYDAYRVVPRTWTLVWLAGAHREAPAETPPEWRDRWASEGARYGQAPLPTTFDDEPNAGEPPDGQQQVSEDASVERWSAIRAAVVPALLLEAEQMGWWEPLAAAPADRRADAPVGPPEIVQLGAALLDRLRLAPSVIAPADPSDGHALLTGALASDGEVRALAAVAGDAIVGLALLTAPRANGLRSLVALGVAASHRRQGLARALLEAAVAGVHGPIEATVGIAERDPRDPLEASLRATIARRLLEGAGFTVAPATGPRGRIDPRALVARRG